MTTRGARCATAKDPPAPMVSALAPAPRSRAKRRLEIIVHPQPATLAQHCAQPCAIACRAAPPAHQLSRQGPRHEYGGISPAQQRPDAAVPGRARVWIARAVGGILARQEGRRPLAKSAQDL